MPHVSASRPSPFYRLSLPSLIISFHIERAFQVAAGASATPQGAWELVEVAETIRRPVKGEGVQLTGPHGVDKSGIGLLAYLMCCVWSNYLCCVHAIFSQLGAGCQRRETKKAVMLYFLKQFWRQYADLILASRPLQTLFPAALQDQTHTRLHYKCHGGWWRGLIRASAVPSVAVIVDDSQHITEEVKDSNRRCSSQEIRSGSYFATHWHTWTSENASLFHRMSIPTRSSFTPRHQAACQRLLSSALHRAVDP